MNNDAILALLSELYERLARTSNELAQRTEERDGLAARVVELEAEKNGAPEGSEKEGQERHVVS